MHSMPLREQVRCVLNDDIIIFPLLIFCLRNEHILKKSNIQNNGSNHTNTQYQSSASIYS